MDPMLELKAAFLEECEELLAALEAKLAVLASGSDDADDVNAAFRAIHSVKGGAGAFGFKSLVAFAHVFEAGLDQVRSGRIARHAAPYDLFLRATDILAQLMAAAREGREEDAPPDMMRSLQQVASGEAVAPAAAPAPGASAPVAAVAAAPASAPVMPTDTRIAIRPHPDLFRRQVDPRHAFASLESLGEIQVRTTFSALPPPAALDPSQCLLSFEVSVRTEAPVSRINELLELHFDSDEFEVLSPSQAASAVLEPAPAGKVAETVSVEAGPVPSPAVPVPAQPASAPAPARAAGGRGRHVQRATGSIRVDLDRIDRLMNLVGEIVITQSMLDQRLLSLAAAETMQITDGLQVLARQTRELQESVMAVRAQPVKNVFQRMPRLVRELGQALGKQARLQIIGEDTEVDKTIIEELADPLTHMIRNAMDHGMESVEERLAAGKGPEGTITLQAEQRSGRIVITVADDGRGVNRERLLAKARARGIVSATDRPSPEEIDAFLFHAGLSTAEAVTDVSGRGVGMDVVKQNVESLGGRVLMSSEPGKGTRFTLLLPLTLAVMDGMIIKTCGQRLVLPIASIRETLQTTDITVERLPGGQEFLRLRDQLSPLVRLSEVLGLGRSEGEQIILMTETDRGSQIGLAVDEIISQQQVVVKSLEGTYGHVPGASAATILGDGLVALIVDVDAIPSLGHLVPAPTMAVPEPAIVMQ